MNFKNIINDLIKDNEVVLYVDMDGVVAAYDFGKPLNFHLKRPLFTNIKIIEDVSKLDKVTVKILSICRVEEQIEQKEQWLDKYMSFISKENRFILPRSRYENELSANIKSNFLKNTNEGNKTVVLLDDDNLVLRTVSDANPKIICIQDSELID